MLPCSYNPKHIFLITCNNNFRKKFAAKCDTALTVRNKEREKEKEEERKRDKEREKEREKARERLRER